MRGIRQRLAMLVATAGVLPLVIYGLVSVTSLRTGTLQSVVAGNLSLAVRGSEQVEQYVSYNVRMLRALATELATTFADRWQQERALRNYVLAFPEFREITLFDRNGKAIVSTRLGPLDMSLPPFDTVDASGLAVSPIQIDDDLLPKASVAIRLDDPASEAAWLAGELRLEELWRLVDRLRVGAHGFALLADRTGRLIAHGDPDQKPRIARGEDVLGHPLARSVLGHAGAQPASLEYTNAQGEPVLAVAAPVASLGGVVIVEQPTEEAYAVATRLERQLLIASAAALAAAIGLGYLWGRSLLTPIEALMRGTEALAEGRLDTRVQIARDDEFRRLGDAFNSMAERLAALQAETRRQERQAMFGRVAAGLVHDLSHPIQNIGNNCRLILKMHDDPEYRETFRRTVERELQGIKRVLEDLRNLARPIPLERFPVDLVKAAGDSVEAMRASAGAAGVELVYEPPPGRVVVDGDLFALGRVYRNLILNAIQATAPSGHIRVRVETRDGRAGVHVADTGCGIPAERLNAIFDDFVTTKRRGLGLGLPVARKIIEQLGGTISVTSEPGRGTTFIVELPLSSAAAPPLHETADA
jgi:signal transduction histidine kinase